MLPTLATGGGGGWISAFGGSALAFPLVLETLGLGDLGGLRCFRMHSIVAVPSSTVRKVFHNESSNQLDV